ncbi:MAG: TlpA disulfide reductase family protein [Burkholderiales bacterium]
MQSPPKLFIGLGLALVLIAAFTLTLSKKIDAPVAAEFVSIKGDKTSLEKLKGKVVLVNFWATDCSSCIAEMPDLIKTHNKYQPQGLETIAVAMSYDPPNYVVAYAEKNKLPFFVSLDFSGEHARAFNNVKLTPTTYIINRQGHIIQRLVGELDFPKLHALIENELKG